jgi:Tol biopolymer transport system component
MQLQIALRSNRSDSRQLWLMNADGGNQRQLTTFAFEVWDPVWVKGSDQ